MKFDNRSNDPKIKEAILKATELLWNISSPMIESISKKNDWKYNSGTGEEIAVKLALLFCKPLPVFTYRPKNPFTRAVGYYDGKAMHINIKKLAYMEHKDIVANLLHEYAHHCGYGHGNNYKTQEKCLYSVPYFISENVGKWL